MIEEDLSDTIAKAQAKAAEASEAHTALLAATPANADPRMIALANARANRAAEMALREAEEV